jgi:hypothetical protein
MIIAMTTFSKKIKCLSLKQNKKELGMTEQLCHFQEIIHIGIDVDALYNE